MGKKVEEYAELFEIPIAQFLYTCIYNMTTREKSNIPSHLYQQINTEKKAKRFCEKSSTDQKREFFSYLDIGFFWTFVNAPNITAKQYLSIMKDIKKEHPVGALKEMCDRGMCITSDDEYIFLMGQMSRMVTSNVYVKNQELLRIGSGIKKWSKKLKPDDEDSSDEIFSALRIIDAAYEKERHIPELLGISVFEYRILSFLYVSKDKYVPFKKIWDRFAGDIPQRKITSGQIKLAKALLIQRHYDWQKKEYIITRAGIRLVNEYLLAIQKSFKFNQ